MNTSQKTFETTKERIHLLQFPQEDVISQPTEKRIRSFQLIRAMRLGNLYKNKVTIHFKDALERGIKVRTTIWGVTQKSVILKKGVTIPIHRITEVA